MTKYPNTPEERGWPLTGIESARRATKAAGQLRINAKCLPFDSLEMVQQLKGWEGSEVDQAGD